MGWDVVHVYKDEGRSGYTGELRPDFEEMMSSSAEGRRCAYRATMID